MTVFNKAMDNIYGPPRDAVDYDRVSQAMAYEGERAMFEAYGAQQVPLHRCHPVDAEQLLAIQIWHLYD